LEVREGERHDGGWMGDMRIRISCLDFRSPGLLLRFIYSFLSVIPSGLKPVVSNHQTSFS
jgi:hypothetical protein